MSRPAGAERLLVVAGEASGDLHAARLVSELRRLAPGLELWGMGGDELERSGVELVAHSREISVVGFTEALRVLPKARRIFRQLLAEVERRGTRRALLVDFAEFNLRLAEKLHERGVQVVYYVSPQVWAWRRGRVRTIERVIDRMLVLFPFEAEFYRRFGVEVEHVGHPLVDEVPELEQVWDRAAPGGAPPPGGYVVSLLPGSRRSEVRAILPMMLASARRLAGRLPVSVRLIQAPTVPDELVAAPLAASGLEVERVRDERFGAIADSHLALCASGTATVEVGLLRTPMIVLYRVTPLTYLLGRMMVRLPHVSMVNLVLGRGVVPELLQRHAEPGRVSEKAASLLTDGERIAEMRAALGELRPRLGEPGASRRAARAAARRFGFEGVS